MSVTEKVGRATKPDLDLCMPGDSGVFSSIVFTIFAVAICFPFVWAAIELYLISRLFFSRFLKRRKDETNETSSGCELEYF